MLKRIHQNLTREAIKWPSYLEIYERHFNKFVGKRPVVVEVGICHGGSLEMWKKYFGADATVIGIDIYEDFVNTTIDGCELVLGDQNDPEFWNTFFQTHPDIDVFIDDGGHQAHQQITTAESVWSHMKEGSVFLCEDTHTSYFPDYFDRSGKYKTFIEYSKNLLEILHINYRIDSERNSELDRLVDLYKDLNCICYYDSVVVLEKKRQLNPIGARRAE